MLHSLVDSAPLLNKIDERQLNPENQWIISLKFVSL